MTAIPYWHVDAFADRPFAGNQAAVMLFDAWPSDTVLQAIAEENAFAETAFLVPDESGAAERELRWFTPACEVRLCGHATLAAGHVLLSAAPGRDAIVFRTRQAGLLEVHRRDTGYELALPAIATEPGDFAQAVAAMGAAPREIARSPDGYTVLLYANETEVRALAPDFHALSALGSEQFIATAPGGDTDVISRVFVPGAGVDEDSATGSAHAVLTPFWAGRLGRERFTAFQASRRGARFDCRLDGGKSWLGGRCVTIVEGKFLL